MTVKLHPWIALAFLCTLNGLAGCELIASVDRGKIPGTGGAGATGGDGGSGALGGMGGGGAGGCETAEECGVDTDCATPSCDDGSCGTTNEDAGTTCDDDGGAVCDGNGACVGCLDDLDCTSPDVCDLVAQICVTPACLNGVVDGLETDVDCGGQDCAPCADGQICVDFGDCDSGFCDASGSGGGGPGGGGNGGAGGGAGQGVCAPCAGDLDCQSSDYCDAQSDCVTKESNGTPCSGASVCQSDECIDGFCCDTACSSTCQACDIGGSVGTCTSHVQGTDPESECGTDVCSGGPSCRCADSMMNGAETDVDCGGGVCPVCTTTGAMCQQGSDCASGVCTNNMCTAPSCGDGVQQAGEGCDDGNQSNADDCPDDGANGGTCQPALCGDGFVDAQGPSTEACDGDGAGTAGETAACDTNCTLAACGDGTLNTTAGEGCDDGDQNNADDCPDDGANGGTCQPALCGDGFVDGEGPSTEACDGNGTGTAGETATCDVDCTAVVCGDGIPNLSAGEGCDDGDLNNADDCPDDGANGGTCQPATCGDGWVDGEGPSTEACDGDGTGTAGETATCDVDCTAVVCGDGIPNLSAGEACDDGDLNNADDCPDDGANGGTCQAASCSDGLQHNQGSGTETAVDCGGLLCDACPGGLLLTEIAVTPTDGEFIEIHNPTSETVDLSNVYLADFSTYYLVADGSAAPSSTDFVLKFPAGTNLGPDGRMVVSLENATDYQATRGGTPNFDIDPADAGAPSMDLVAGTTTASSGLTNGGEMVAMFYWDGSNDLVQDIDYLLFGSNAAATDKTGVTVGASSYLADTATGTQAFSVTHSQTFDSINRCNPDEGSENLSGGNGFLGHDETSENLDATWLVNSATPGFDNFCPGNMLWQLGFGDATVNDIHADWSTTGNVYVVGSFTESGISFGGSTFTNQGGSDIFVAAFTSGGSHLWSVAVGGSGNDEATDVNVDSNGDVVVTGNFLSSSISFGTTNLSNNGSGDIFVTKLAGATGAEIWATSAGGANYDTGWGIDVDWATGDVFVGGFYESASINLGTTTLANSNTGSSEIFIGKLAAASGAEIWARSVGASGFDQITGLAVDGSTGDVYASGHYNSASINFGGAGDALTNLGGWDVFAVRLSSAAGAHVWSVGGGGTADDFAFDVGAVDANAFPIAIAGTFASSTFTLGASSTGSVSGATDAFAAVLSDSTGATASLYTPTTSSAASEFRGVEVPQGAGTIVLGGYFVGGAAFDAGNGTLPDDAGDNPLVVHLDLAGTPRWSRTASGTGASDRVLGVASPNGRVYAGGFFNSTSINWGFNGDAISNVGAADAFVAALEMF
jgi:hypothetical protein